MGWVGWTEEQTMTTDMQSIEAAYRGRHEMLQSLAGREIASSRIDAPKVMTTDLFAAIFGGNR